jgi:hypothetical protein
MDTLHEIGSWCSLPSHRLRGYSVVETTKCSNCRQPNANQPDFCLFDIERIEPPNRKWNRTHLTMFVKIIQRLLSSRGAS